MGQGGFGVLQACHQTPVACGVPGFVLTSAPSSRHKELPNEDQRTQSVEGHHHRGRQGRNHLSCPDRYRRRRHRDGLDHQRGSRRIEAGKGQSGHSRDQGERRDGGRRLIDRRTLIAGLSAAALAPHAAWAESVTDAAGRNVPVPAKVTRVFPAGPPAAILLYTLAPELLIGWPRANRAEECVYMLPEICTRPEVGRITGRGNTANLETVLALKPDLILDVGSTSATFVSLADRVQEQTGIPYALLDGRFDAIAPTFRKLGELTHRQAQADDFARYAESAIATIKGRVDKIPEQSRPRVYYGRGPRGLE